MGDRLVSSSPMTPISTSVSRLALTLLLGFLSACGGSGSEETSDQNEAEWLADVAAARGLAAEHGIVLGERKYMPEIMGSGAAVFDADGDGHLDVYLVNAGREDGSGIANRMFFRRGDRYLEESCGLEDSGYGMGVAIGDIDGDGDLDCFVCNLGANRLYRNEGAGRFLDVTAESGIDRSVWSSTATFYDHDGDGRLDIYVVNYVAFDPAKRCTDPRSFPEYCGPSAFPGVADELWLNRGEGRFEEVGASLGLTRVPAPGLGVAVDDFDGDGRTDILVANDGKANQLWINRRDRMEDEAFSFGVAMNAEGQPEASMGTALGDVDLDGDLDLFLTHLVGESNTFYRRTGAAFEDVTGRVGMQATSMSSTGFGTAFGDLDHDGWPDVVVANGRVTQGKPRSGAGEILSQYAEPNQVFMNREGQAFVEQSQGLRSFLGTTEVSRGLILFDSDEDGDLDILVTNTSGPVRLWENRFPKRGHWLKVEVEQGPAAGSASQIAIGARVTVVCGEKKRVATRRYAGGYQTSSSAPLHFGLGTSESYDRIEVVWPDGQRQEFPGGAADRALVLRRQ
jgi:enediyne biosynthesis protein E4